MGNKSALQLEVEKEMGFLFARKTAPGWDSWGDEVEGGETE